jgi:hypothetical protein
MKNLVLEAVKAFPVWPQTAGLILFNTDTGELHQTLSTEDEFILNRSKGITNSKVWQVACTREDHIRKRIELFEGAPEGATHYGLDGLFYRISENSAHYLNPFTGWSKDSNGKDWLSKRLIPRPTPEELEHIAEIDSKNKGLDDVTDTGDGEWLPEVGEVCESMLINAGWGVGQLLYISDKLLVWQDSDTKDETANRPEHRTFRPLKTEAEKERERLYRELDELDAHLDDYQINLVIEFIQGRNND